MIGLLVMVPYAPGAAPAAHRLGPEPGRLILDRGTGVPCIGLALAASGVLWAGFGCALAVLLP
jgi:hypothetical protein